MVDNWHSIESRPDFEGWLSEPFEHINGSRYRYALLRPSRGGGFVWAVYVCTLGEDAREDRRSRGEFYDDAPGHPEGARAWAMSWARDHMRRDFRREPNF